MTPADLMRQGCAPTCLLGTGSRSRCRCACRGRWHGLLTAADITALVDSQRGWQRPIEFREAR